MKVKVRVAKNGGESSRKEIEITTEYITLGAFLKFAGLCQTGGEAKLAIEDGLVKVNSEVCTMRGKKLYPGNTVDGMGQSFVITAGESE